MALLPSYQEATSGPDWLNLVAPYCKFEDYRALCQVSRQFRRVFAPRLWRDLLHSARLTGLDPGDGEHIEYSCDIGDDNGCCTDLHCFGNRFDLVV